MHEILYTYIHMYTVRAYTVHTYTVHAYILSVRGVQECICTALHGHAASQIHCVIGNLILSCWLLRGGAEDVNDKMRNMYTVPSVES